jgi:hypothetical protein
MSLPSWVSKDLEARYHKRSGHRSSESYRWTTCEDKEEARTKNRNTEDLLDSSISAMSIPLHLVDPAERNDQTAWSPV